MGRVGLAGLLAAGDDRCGDRVGFDDDEEGRPVDEAGLVSGRRPGTEGPPDLPFMTERVDDPADAPAMLVSYPGRCGGTSVHRLVENSFGVTDHQQRPGWLPRRSPAG